MENKEKISSMIDHTLLKATAGVNDIIKLCQEAKKFSFASVCVNSYYVPLCVNELKDCSVKVCTVVGFPLGACSSQAKAFEAVDAIKNGADEIDMVINVGAAKNGLFNIVEQDILAVVNASKECGKTLNKNIIVKVILETCYLDDSTVVTCCQCAVRAGADFVKTSTGFGTPKNSDGSDLPNGASVHHVALMRKTVGPDFGVKASGGVRTARIAMELIKAGANRIGTSNGVQIINGL